MRLAIIGLGGMGAWFAKELSKTEQVAVFDIDYKKITAIKKVIHLNDVSELQSFRPEFLLNAVDLQNTIPVFDEVLKYINNRCIIADITSIKGKLFDYYRKLSFRFVSFHPMFGPQFANLKQVKGENVIIISESDVKAKKFWYGFFEKLNLCVFEYSFKEHDRLMSYSLTLPFASSIVFSACITTNTVPGTTFSRHRKIARRLLREDDYLLAEVLFNSHSLKQLETICSNLEFLKHIIIARDYDLASKFFQKLRNNLGPYEL
jgi:prephenate dehydrogenase